MVSALLDPAGAQGAVHILNVLPLHTTELHVHQKPCHHLCVTDKEEKAK